MIDEKSCESLTDANYQVWSVLINEIIENVQDMYIELEKEQVGRTYKTWKTEYLDNSIENIKRARTILIHMSKYTYSNNELVNPIGMISIAKRYKRLLYDNLEFAEKFGLLLINTPLTLGIPYKSEKGLLANSVQLNSMYFGNLLPIRLYQFNTIKRSMGLFYTKSYYNVSCLRDLRWWWALTDKIEVSQTYINIYQKQFSLTEKQFASKVRNYIKKHKNVLQEIKHEEGKLKQRLFDLKLI